MGAKEKKIYGRAYQHLKRLGIYDDIKNKYGRGNLFEKIVDVFSERGIVETSYALQREYYRNKFDLD